MSIDDLFKKISQSRSGGGAPRFIVVGLGNMGKEYDGTRHNAGFCAIDHIAEKSGVSINKAKFKSLCADADMAGERVLLMKPQTYMNSSGTAVSEAADFYKIAPENIIVLCDDVSFDPGRIRIRRDGSAGGHNGLKSINTWLGTEKYPRVKIGVGKKPTPEYDMADWVLGKLSEDGKKAIASRYDDIYEAVKLILIGDTEKAMCLYN